VAFDGKSFRTKNINAVFELIDNETNLLRATKKDNPDELSVSVAGEGIVLWLASLTSHPPAFGL